MGSMASSSWAIRLVSSPLNAIANPDPRVRSIDPFAEPIVTCLAPITIDEDVESHVDRWCLSYVDWMLGYNTEDLQIEVQST